jgi:hypothetical protein
MAPPVSPNTRFRARVGRGPRGWGVAGAGAQEAGILEFFRMASTFCRKMTPPWRGTSHVASRRWIEGRARPGDTGLKPPRSIATPVLSDSAPADQPRRSECSRAAAAGARISAPSAVHASLVCSPACTPLPGICHPPGHTGAKGDPACHRARCWTAPPPCTVPCVLGARVAASAGRYRASPALFLTSRPPTGCRQCPCPVLRAGLHAEAAGVAVLSTAAARMKAPSAL